MDHGGAIRFANIREYLSYQFCFLNSTESGATPLHLYYCSSQNVNALYSSNVRIPIIRTIVQDDNHDGLVDRIEFGAEMPLSQQESIQRVVILLYYDITFSSKAKINFDAVSLLDFDSSLPLSTVISDGDLILRQATPLSSKGG